MPKYKVTIYVKIGPSMSGIREHPASKAKDAIRTFENKAVKAIGRFSYQGVKVESLVNKDDVAEL